MFEWDSVSEWHDVARDARDKDIAIYMGRVFGFAVVKHSEFDQSSGSTNAELFRKALASSLIISLLLAFKM